MERGLRTLDVDISTYDRAFGLLNRIVDTRPAVVILDVRMPGLDGASLAGLVREDELIADTRIVLHSAIDEVILSRKAKQCRADGYLVKGPGIEALLDAVTRWLPDPSPASGTPDRRGPESVV